MSDNLKDIDETQFQKILKAMSEMPQRKPPKKKPPKKAIDATSSGHQSGSPDS